MQSININEMGNELNKKLHSILVMCDLLRDGFCDAIDENKKLKEKIDELESPKKDSAK